MRGTGMRGRCKAALNAPATRCMQRASTRHGKSMPPAERCRSGRTGRSRKPLCALRTQGSNPCLSAIISLAPSSLRSLAPRGRAKARAAVAALGIEFEQGPLLSAKPNPVHTWRSAGAGVAASSDCAANAESGKWLGCMSLAPSSLRSLAPRGRPGRPAGARSCAWLRVRTVTRTVRQTLGVFALSHVSRRRFALA